MSHLSDGIPFWKVAGGANDYVVLDGRGGALPERLEASFVSAVCMRRWGVGSDGILYVRDPAEGGDYRLDFYNPDGTTHGLCGNGARCVARLARREEWAGTSQKVELEGGSLEAEVLNGSVRLHLEAPTLEVERRDHGLGDRVFSGSLVRIRVPHLVVDLPEAEILELDVDLWGRRLREHPDYQPRGTNVTFAAVTGPRNLRVRTYERGVEGETLACGSGAVAAAAAFVRRGVAEAPVDCRTASGTVLRVGFGPGEVGADARATLEGDARLVARGTLGPDLLPAEGEATA